MLAREHLSSRLARHRSSVEQAVGLYGDLAVHVSPLAIPRVVRDPDDDQVIACALTAQAGFIVSGDTDLLTLCEHQGIAILTAARALERIKGVRQSKT